MYNKPEFFRFIESDFKGCDLKGLVLFSIGSVDKKISDLKEEIDRNETLDTSYMPHNERHEIINDINAAKAEIARLEKAKCNFNASSHNLYAILSKKKKSLEYEISSLESRIENYEINCQTAEFGKEANGIYAEELDHANKELQLKEQLLKSVLSNMKQLSY